MNIRCVVTGQTPEGKSVFVRDEGIEPVRLALMPGFEFHRVWASDAKPALPSDGTQPPHGRYFPPEHGFRFAFFTVPPRSHSTSEQVDVVAGMTEIATKLPGLADVLEPGHPGMHTTDTVDFDVVISGEVCLELDDGAEVLLKPGDCVVQNGTRHRWRNRSAEKCVIAVCLLGAKRAR
jgi:mannose-6-phosphate isomerase-like protein (cupin superfamily)